MSNARMSTNLLLEMVASGVLDKDFLIEALVKYMSEADVKDFMRIYNLDEMFAE